MSCWYAAATARTASSPSSPSAASAKTLRVSARHRSTAARNMACLLGKRRKRYGCETPTRLAIASVEVALYPPRANSVIAARMTLSRRSSALILAMQVS